MVIATVTSAFIRSNTILTLITKYKKASQNAFVDDTFVIYNIAILFILFCACGATNFLKTKDQHFSCLSFVLVLIPDHP